MIHGDTDAAMAILASNVLEEMDESFAGIPPAILHHVANELVSFPEEQFPEEQCQPEAEAEASHRKKLVDDQILILRFLLKLPVHLFCRLDNDGILN
jgi:hypothetical protein